MNKANQTQTLKTELYEKQRSVRRLKTLSVFLLVLNLAGLVFFLLMSDQGRFQF